MTGLIIGLVAFAVLVLGWVVLWHVVFGDELAYVWLEVQYRYDEPTEWIELRLAPKLPRLLGHDYVTLGRLIRTRLPDALWHPEIHVPILRHEAEHTHQQRGWGYWGFWLLAYLVNPWFRKKEEAKAMERETQLWPMIVQVRRP